MPEPPILDYQRPLKRRAGYIKRLFAYVLLTLVVIVTLALLFDMGRWWYRDYRSRLNARAMTQKLSTYHPVSDVLCWSNDPSDIAFRKGYTVGNGWISRDGPNELVSLLRGNGEPLFVYLGNYLDDRSMTLKSTAARVLMPGAQRYPVQRPSVETFVGPQSSELIWLPDPITFSKTVRIFTAMPYKPDARVFTMRIELDGQEQWLHIDFDRPALDRTWLSTHPDPASSPLP